MFEFRSRKGFRFLASFAFMVFMYVASQESGTLGQLVFGGACVCIGVGIALLGIAPTRTYPVLLGEAPARLVRDASRPAARFVSAFIGVGWIGMGVGSLWSALL